MKTKYWLLILGALLALCGILAGILLLGPGATHVQVLSHGHLLYTLSLSEDREVIVENGDGVNVVTVQGGKVAVTQANCPDGYCMHRGWCSGGLQIVCLPNSLVLRFTTPGDVDAAVG